MDLSVLALVVIPHNKIRWYLYNIITQAILLTFGKHAVHKMIYIIHYITCHCKQLVIINLPMDNL